MVFQPTSTQEFGPTAVRWSQELAIRSADVSLSRLRNLGVGIQPANRIARAKAHLLNHREAGSLFPAGTDTQVVRMMMEAHRTLAESYVITSALDQPDETLRATLARLLQGHDSANGDSRSTPRDMQFELLIAALMKLGGIPDVVMGEPDIRFHLGAQVLGVAAKRVRSRRKLRERVGEALRQLEQNSMDGIIALNVDACAERAFARDGEDAVHPAVTAIVEGAAERVGQLDPDGSVIGIVAFGTVFGMHEAEDGYGCSLSMSVAMHWRVSEGREHSVTAFSERFASRLSSRIRSLVTA